MANADRILLDGLDPLGRRIDLAIVGSEIAEIADSGELKHNWGARTETCHLDGRQITPGLWDAHIHLYHCCLARGQVSLRACQSRQELLSTVAEAVTSTEWLLGFGWNNSQWVDDRPPSRQELDAVTGDRPALFWCSDMHSALVNTQALAEAGMLEESMEVDGGVIERDASGSPTGWLKELAANHVRELIPALGDEELSVRLRETVADLHRMGITGVTDQRIKDMHEGPRLFRLMRRLELEGDWRLRTSVNVAAHNLPEAAGLGLSTGFGTDRLRIGHIKLFADGTLGSRTARMLAPFLSGGSGDDERGLYLTQPEEMREVFHQAAQAGFSLSVHAIGDEANRVCLNLFAELDAAGFPRPKIPHRIEHAQILDDFDLSRFRDLGVTASVQAGHAQDDRFAAVLGLGERARLCYRFGDLWRAGALLAFGTDAPVSEMNPLYGMQVALERRTGDHQPWFADQALPSEVVLDGYTIGAAKASGWDDITGLLTAGYRADLVVWEGSPLEPGTIAEAKVWQTYFDGELVFHR